MLEDFNTYYIKLFSERKICQNSPAEIQYADINILAAKMLMEEILWGVVCCDSNWLSGCDDRGIVLPWPFMLLKAALWADVISKGSTSLQSRLTSQTRLGRWISQGTAELQETNGAGSFQPVSLQWTGWSRQLLLRQGCLQSTNCVVQFWVTFMMQFFGLKLTVNNWNDCLYLRKTNSYLSCSRQHALEILNTKVRWDILFI